MTTVREPRASPIESHLVHSKRLIEHAEEQLARGDRLQASEKAWGAVAHRLKAVAEGRGEKYEQHRQVYGLVRKLDGETDDPIEDLFETADSLHKNYYVDSIPLDALARRVERVKRLLDILGRPEFMRPSPPRQGEPT